jgi:predicted nuclease with TOPRIM domain
VPAFVSRGLRRPDITPTLDELWLTAARALAARTARGAEEQEERDELARLRGENRDLRGAIEHLEGVARHEHELESAVVRLRDGLHDAEQERSRLAEALESARGSRIFRLTGRPSALRDGVHS